MQTSLIASGAAPARSLLAACAFSVRPATTAYITNEKGNSITVVDLDKLEVVQAPSRSASGRAASR